ncbi:MAG: hypothetical protein HQL31_13050 [Planctomycetes bacterium]|nr:hypothetical protein [Planctomycetota bacterium]
MDSDPRDFSTAGTVFNTEPDSCTKVDCLIQSAGIQFTKKGEPPSDADFQFAIDYGKNLAVATRDNNVSKNAPGLDGCDTIGENIGIDITKNDQVTCYEMNRFPIQILVDNIIRREFTFPENLDIGIQNRTDIDLGKPFVFRD